MGQSRRIISESDSIAGPWLDTVRQRHPAIHGSGWDDEQSGFGQWRFRFGEHAPVFPWLARAINTYGLDPAPTAAIRIPGYRWRRWRHRFRYLHRKIRDGEATDLLNVLINKAKYIWWFHV
jgi:hypothetical protein